MIFSDAPYATPLCLIRNGHASVYGLKKQAAGYIYLQTESAVYLHDSVYKALVQVTPFQPQNTLPVDGWQIAQLDFHFTENHN